MPHAALHILAALLLTSTTAWGADQLLLGRKLLIKNPPSGPLNNKVVLVAKDPSITLGAAGGAGDPQCTGAGGGGGSLRFVASGGAGDVTIPLPCVGWTTNGANTLYQYKDVTGATCKLVLVKAGVLAKAVCKGSQVAIDLDGTMSPVAVVATLNAEAYCTEFGGVAVQDGSDDRTFLRTNAVAPGSCAASAPTTTTTSTPATTTTTSTLAACGSASGTCGGSCPDGIVCSFNSTSLDCECPTTTQCEAGTCVGDLPFSCAGCPSCPAGYTCGPAPSSACATQPFMFVCIGPPCGSDCSCPAEGHCAVSIPTTTTSTSSTTSTTTSTLPTQCQAGTCVIFESLSCAGCPSCPAGYTCGGAFSSDCGSPPQGIMYGCVGPACGSDCSCPGGGSCSVP